MNDGIKTKESEKTEKSKAANDDIKVFDWSFYLFVFLFIVLIGIICFFPYWLTRPANYKYLDFTNTGQIGDTIGGTMSPFIAIAAALLTFIAFWVQYKANKAQTQQFLKQDTDTKIDRFENKFYELLRLHKENVNEISIDGYEQQFENRKAFVYMYREFRYTFFVAKEEYNKLRRSKKLKTICKNEDLLNLAYIFFYAGVGIHSDKLNKAAWGNRFDKILYESVNKKLIAIQDELADSETDNSKPSKKLPEIKLRGIGIARFPRIYRPFKGHLSRFGHYYRHLFQTVKFVLKHEEEKLINKTQALEYLRTLRAQLSDHEQLMLYYNAVAGFGKAWIDKKYFTEYKMIHNLPLPLADFGITPEEKFKDEIANNDDLFEWKNLATKS
jgi:hypothetical protein